MVALGLAGCGGSTPAAHAPPDESAASDPATGRGSEPASGDEASAPGDEASAPGGAQLAAPDDDDRSDAGSAAPLPAGCLRQRKGFLYRCSGMAPRPGESNVVEVMVCDRCLSDGDCTDQPGGRCVSIGGHMCTGAERLECRYPSPQCGGEICVERPPPPPPSAPPRR